MATVSLSPSPAHISDMSPRRAPLASNPNVANSPIRGVTALAGLAKQKRSHANLQREESYGQPPPGKKQALENGVPRPIRSPPRFPAIRQSLTAQRASATAIRSAGLVNKERISRSAVAQPALRTVQDVDNEKEVWKKHYKAKFPKMVFYFENIPDDVLAKLTKKVTYFGACHEPFFSISVTHVITTRAIPPERAEHGIEHSARPPSAASHQQKQNRQQAAEDQPQTINPSLLDRNPAVRRKLLFDFRQAQASSQQPDEAALRNGGGIGKPRNNDVLQKAREMGKKIWSLDKFQTMLAVLLESEAHVSSGSLASRSFTTRSQQGAYKGAQEPNLLQLLHNERINGPSDRDPTAVSRELVYFKGPYIYVWDMDEKQKPIMVRDYPKVTNKADGEWPQFRSVGNGRCPFVEEVDTTPERERRKAREREKAKARAAAAAAEAAAESTAAAAAAAAKRQGDAASTIKASNATCPAQAITGKRSLAEMEEGAVNRAAGRTQMTSADASVKAAAAAPLAPASKAGEAPATQNAFISRAAGARRLLGGEPVASGMQPSSITSAIRSQMISSASGIHGAKAGTSKEMHGLQRKVLQKSTAPASHDLSSRRLVEISADVASSRSTVMGRQTPRTLQAQEEDGHSQRPALATAEGNEKSLRSQQIPKSKKDLKPGYCENCQDKFHDFDDHIASRKHRKFAENDDNWVELDSLLGLLERVPRQLSPRPRA